METHAQITIFKSKDINHFSLYSMKAEIVFSFPKSQNSYDAKVKCVKINETISELKCRWFYFNAKYENLFQV